MNDDFRWWHLSRKDHSHIRQWCKTLNALNIIEIAVVLFFSYICYDILNFIMEQVSSGNNHTVLAVLATGVTVPIVGLVFGMLKSINNTFTNTSKEE